MKYYQVKLLDKISMRIGNTLLKNLFEDKLRPLTSVEKHENPKNNPRDVSKHSRS